jgi:hypothetical protein
MIVVNSDITTSIPPLVETEHSLRRHQTCPVSGRY